MKDSAQPVLRDYLIYAPTLAASIAIIYDVGYFWALNIHYFFFFSLSEHIVFAMQTVPLAIFVLGGVLIVVMLDRNIPYPSDSRRKLGIVGLVSAALAVLITAVFREIWVTICLLSITLVCVSLSPFHNRTFILNFTYLFFGPLCIVLLIGLASGQAQLHPHSSEFRIQIKSEGVYMANLIRAGERGILFSVPTEKAIYFRDWTRVVSVDIQTDEQ